MKVEYLKVLSNLDTLAKMDLTNAMELIGITVENNAKLHSPVDTGQLRRSITHNIVNDKTVEIGTNLEYAPLTNMRRINRAKSVKPKQLHGNTEVISEIAKGSETPLSVDGE